MCRKRFDNEIEDRLLFLIQLWFDTFMCHEDEFKEIVMVYKQLRKDGVVFPMRDPKNQFLIDFKGKKSPIFETIEGNFIYEEPVKTLSRRRFTVKDIKPGIDSDSKKDTRPAPTYYSARTIPTQGFFISYLPQTTAEAACV